MFVPILSASGAATASVSGTVVSGLTETQVVSGGETLIIILTNDTWLAAGTGPVGTIANTQAIIDGITAAESEATGWNAEVRDKEVVGSVVRDSDTQITITWSPAPAYDITANETITVTVPAAAVTGAAEITAAPTFGITADVTETEVASAGGYIVLASDRRRTRREIQQARRRLGLEIEDADLEEKAAEAVQRAAVATLKRRGTKAKTKLRDAIRKRFDRARDTFVEAVVPEYQLERTPEEIALLKRAFDDMVQRRARIIEEMELAEIQEVIIPRIVEMRRQSAGNIQRVTMANRVSLASVLALSEKMEGISSKK